MNSVPLFAHLVSTLILAATAEPLRARAIRQVMAAFEHAGRKAPALDATLNAAAQILAEDAASRGVREAADPMSIAEAVSDSGGFDPNPRTLVVRGAPPEEALRALAERRDLGQDPASQVGVGFGVDGERAAVVVLGAQRKIRMQSIARSVAKPDTAPLCIQLNPPLERPELFVTRPAGTVEKIAFNAKGNRACANLTLSPNGRHTVEILARSERGPEVAALFFVDVGSTSRQRHQRIEEPGSVGEAKAAIFKRINSLRKAHGLSELSLDPEASKLAQAYADRMARENFFAHVAPDGMDLRARAQRAGYSYRSISENLGLARGPVAAHFGIEQSPGHLKALLEPSYGRLGLGISQRRVDDRDETIVTEILSNPPAMISDPAGDAYRSIDRKRRELRLPPLRRNAALEKIAADHAWQALKLEKPSAELPGSAVHDRVFASLQTVKSTSVDIFISDNPGEVPLSKGLKESENNLVGIGVAKGNTKFGKDQFWVVEIFAVAR